MTDIAILTYWGVPNYGGWTQAYALSAVINRVLGKKARHIAYLEQSHWNNYYQKDPKAYNCFFYGWDEIPHTGLYTKELLEAEDFDTVITGADSIWSFEHFAIEPDLHLMGRGLHARHLYAYAPSCDMLHKEELTDEMITALAQYDRITVRDAYSKDLLHQADALADRDISIVVDPALLWDFKKDERVISPVFEGYIAVYGGKFSDRYIERAIRFAKEKQLMLVGLGYTHKWCDINILRNELRPFEWLGMFSGAEYVFTSTFHGLMVGLNFEKQIVFDQVENVKNRSDTLISSMGIQDGIRNFNSEIDYQDCCNKLERARQYSMEQLEAMLS